MNATAAETVPASPQAPPVTAARALSLPSIAVNTLSLVAGALLACAFAPLGLWPLALLCPAAQMWLWEGLPARAAALSGFWFGVGTFGLGTWWLYVSIHGLGGAPIWLALALVIALVMIMGAYQALLGYLCARLLPPAGAARYLLGMPALWLLIEWWRGWFLSGFPWLSLGYSQTDSWLRGFAPLIGVYGISAVLLLASGALLALLRGSRRLRIVAAALLLLPLPVGAALERAPWTQPMGPPISVAVLQGAVPQELKWQQANIGPTRELYARLENEALGARLIVWPEAAVPQLANEIPQYLGDIYSRARAHGSDVIMGILRVNEAGDYFNSIMALADGVSFYDKHHLVPFAETFPVPSFIRSWLRLMNLPYSDFTAGAAAQPLMSAAGARIAPSICYEDAYGSTELPQLAAGATVLVNVTNDAWFGHSWARYQHLQISRMRALETGRPLIRAASDGVSALIGSNGKVLAQAAEFKPTVLHGSVQPRTGLTGYVRVGNVLVVVLGLLAASCAIGSRFGNFRNR
jgi:apolipoprotein N-acyltransferase